MDPSLQTIARCNAAALVGDETRVGIVGQGGSWISTAFFVTTLLAVIALVNGLLQLMVNWIAAVILLLVAGLAGAAANDLLHRKRALAASSAANAPWLVFDLEAKVLRDRMGKVLAPLEQVRVRRAWQATSSSRALCVKAPGVSLVIARGNPFGDSVDDIEDALRARGILVE